jgi:sugar-specific transcriptional regulator TrmB
MNINGLENAGLNQKQSKIYLAMLEEKETTATKLAQKTSINRSLIYFILEDLSKKGFASYIIRNNIRYYKPIEPQKILELLEEKKKSFKELLPALIEKAKKSGKKPEIEILEGIEGIKTILNEILRFKEDWIAFNIPGTGHAILGYLSDSFQNQRQKEKISLNVICNDTEGGRIAGKRFSKMKFTKVKYLGQQESPASNWIYADRVIIIFWYPEFPFAVRIIDKRFADSYRDYFNLLWKIAER